MSIRFIFKLCTFIGICMIINNQANAQIIKRANSPYSYFGIGDLEPTTFGMSRALGGLSIGLRSAANATIDNPASLSAVKRTTLETGFDFNGIRLNNGTETQRMSDMGISYLTLTVPVTKFWSSSIGVLPFSSVYYSIDERLTTNEDVGEQLYVSEGVGSIYQLYWGNGFKYKAFSAGFQVAYAFGTINRSIISALVDQSNTLINLTSTENIIGGFMWNTGIQFHPKITDRIQLTIGATLGTGSKLTDQGSYTLGRSADASSFVDTIIQSNYKRDIQLPTKFGFGTTINKGSEWMAGFDIEMANWGTTNLTDANAEYTDQFKVKIGAAFVPYREGIRRFFNQTQYRFGAYFNNNYFDVRETGTNNFQAVNQFGFTFGAGFPLSKKRSSRLNVAFDVGQRGATQNNSVRETYFKAHIGISLNDIWFIKPKYD